MKSGGTICRTTVQKTILQVQTTIPVSRPTKLPTGPATELLTRRPIRPARREVTVQRTAWRMQRTTVETADSLTT